MIFKASLYDNLGVFTGGKGSTDATCSSNIFQELRIRLSDFCKVLVIRGSTGDSL